MDFTDSEVKKYFYSGEFGDGQLFAKIVGDKVVYDHNLGQWFIFNGICWQPDVTNSLYKLASNAIRNVYFKYSQTIQLEDETNKALGKRLTRLTFVNSIKRVLEAAQSERAFTGQWNAIPHKLACENGVINLKTGKLETGNPQDYLSYQIPTTFDETTTCPRFEQFLQEVFNSDNEIINFIQVLLGYGMIGASLEHILPILVGENGFNGKDSLLKAVSSVLGNGICDVIPGDVLVETKNGQNNLANAHQLANLHIAYTSETEDGALLRSDRVKNLTGNSNISIKKLWQDVFTVKPKYLLLLLTNFAPKADSIDDALWERIALVEFTQRFVSNPVLENEHAIDVNLDAKLAKEKSGILNWLTKGAVKYYDYGMVKPEKVLMSTIAYRERNDIVGEFVTDYCTVSKEERCLMGELYDQFAAVNGTQIKKREFVNAMVAKGFEKKKFSDGWYLMGIRAGQPIKPTFEDEFEPYLQMVQMTK